MPTAASRRAYQGPVLFSYGFRPFFLGAAGFAALTVPIWAAVSLGLLPGVNLDRDWHVHEMVFGYLAAVIAGFLLTSVPNWTGRLPVMGAPLAGLVGLWAAGRLAMLFQDALGPVAATVIDGQFLVVFAGLVWREIVRGANWRNLPVCGLVTLMALANIGFHLRYLWPEAGPPAERAALAAAAVLIGLIGGRITPSFTRNWLLRRGETRLPAAADRFDLMALILVAAAGLSWIVLPLNPLSGALLVAAGAGSALRLARWRGDLTLSEPLVWSLHLGFAWLSAGLMLLGASVLWPQIVPLTGGVHALTAGAVGAMTLAVMTRASLGHTGRPLTADSWTLAIYLLVNGSAALRVASAFAGDARGTLLAASAIGWSTAFALFVVAYGALLSRPRPSLAPSAPLPRTA